MIKQTRRGQLSQKRQRAAALQDLSELGVTHEKREASWSAAAPTAFFADPILWLRSHREEPSLALTSHISFPIRSSSVTGAMPFKLSPIALASPTITITIWSGSTILLTNASHF